MTSQIISETIDENFPVAGQDNDSQGFRDNFNIIKTGLGVASSEITGLQERVLVRNPSGDYTNNLAGNPIIEAELNACTFVANVTGATGLGGSTGDLDWNTGTLFDIQLTQDATLVLRNFPRNADNDETYAVIRVLLSTNADAQVWNATFSGNGGNILSLNGTGSVVATPNTLGQKKMVEIFTYDAGLTFFLREIGTFR